MGKYYYRTWESISIGDREEFSIEMTDDLVRRFSNVIGDTDSFHISDEAAKDTVFQKRICHGAHLLSYVCVAIGQKLPGFGTIYCSHEFEFLEPVYIGDTIRVELEVLEKLDHHRLAIRTDIYRGDSSLVMKGKAVVKTYK